MYLAQSLTPFVIGLVLYGFTGFVIAPLSSYIAGARAQMPVTRALTTAYAFFNVGGVLGPLFAWSLGDRVTLRGAYGLACVIFTLSTVTVTLTGDQPIEPSNGDRRAAGLLRNRRFATFLLISAVFLFGGYLSWPLTPNYLQSLRDIPARTIWLFGALNSLGMVTISFTLGHLSAKRGIFIIQTLVIASILFFWRGPGMVWYGLAYLLAGGYRTLRSFISAQVESLVQPANLGLAFGAVETTIGLVMVAAPPLAGWLYQRTPESPYTVSLGVLLLALPLTALISPGRARLPRWIRTSFNHKHRRKEAGG
jgi:hypothetical protein